MAIKLAKIVVKTKIDICFICLAPCVCDEDDNEFVACTKCAIEHGVGIFCTIPELCLSEPEVNHA